MLGPVSGIIITSSSPLEPPPPPWTLRVMRFTLPFSTVIDWDIGDMFVPSLVPKISRLPDPAGTLLIVALPEPLERIMDLLPEPPLSIHLMSSFDAVDKARRQAA